MDLGLTSRGFGDTCRICNTFILRKSRSKPRICGTCERKRHEPIADHCKDCGTNIIRCNIRKSRLCSRCKKLRERDARARAAESGPQCADFRPGNSSIHRGPLVRLGNRNGPIPQRILNPIDNGHSSFPMYSNGPIYSPCMWMTPSPTLMPEEAPYGPLMYHVPWQDTPWHLATDGRCDETGYSLHSAELESLPHPKRRRKRRRAEADDNGIPVVIKEEPGALEPDSDGQRATKHLSDITKMENEVDVNDREPCIGTSACIDRAQEECQAATSQRAVEISSSACKLTVKAQVASPPINTSYRKEISVRTPVPNISSTCCDETDCSTAATRQADWSALLSLSAGPMTPRQSPVSTHCVPTDEAPKKAEGTYYAESMMTWGDGVLID
eukprot:GHVO01068200.1.p1 GENE.GHVO01068200.1~~GHVO01068200.1.p1  ORF type:complete len:385 (-),score=29.37 GHVO01068200.1:43-1197(-)